MRTRLGQKAAWLAALGLVFAAQSGCELFFPKLFAPPDVILEWNAVALDANARDHTAMDVPADQLSETQGPPASARVLAIVHAAMFDALNSIEQRYAEYITTAPNADGASVDAAVAQAAHDTLAALIPGGASFYTTALNETLARVPDGDAKTRGIAVGQAVAQAILTARENDPDFLYGDYTPTGLPGNHDADPTNPNQGFIGPDVGMLPPFGVEDISIYRAPVPPTLISAEYTAAFNEVKALGEFRGGMTGDTVPTDDETYVIANYWSYNGSPEIGTPPRLYNQIARVVAIDRCNAVHENARLFALINLAMADGGISAWDTKYAYDYWRPIRGIREAATDGNPDTEADTEWVALGGSRSNPFPLGDGFESNFSPPFPAYTSGHATFGAAMFKTLANFYQTDDISFSFMSQEWNGTTTDQFNRVRPAITRTYNSLSHAAAENAASRVFNGVHWRYDGSEGVRAGNAIADYIFNNLLRPQDGTGTMALPDEDFETQIDEILTDAMGG